MAVLLAAFDELERRRRRDHAQLRSWLAGIRADQDGSISPSCPRSSADRVMDGRMVLLYTFEDTADALQVSIPTVKRLVASGALPAVKVGASTRIRTTDLAAFVAGLDMNSDRTRRMDGLEER